MAALLVVVPTGPATAGGGCHRDAAEGQAEGFGSTVEMRENCFTPTVLRVEPGTDVSFVNRDEQAHQVDGVGWGGGIVMAPGTSFASRFDQPGTYPYSCHLHPGMNGAVVVGDGRGSGRVVHVVPVSALAAASQPARSVRTSSSGLAIAPAVLVTGASGRSSSASWPAMPAAVARSGEGLAGTSTLTGAPPRLRCADLPGRRTP